MTDILGYSITDFHVYDVCNLYIVVVFFVLFGFAAKLKCVISPAQRCSENRT